LDIVDILITKFTFNFQVSGVLASFIEAANPHCSGSKTR